jgi:hypothetical protein
MANGKFLDIPTGKGIGIAIAVIVGFMVLAFILYQLNWGAYSLKVADSFINGAIVGILFAILKAMIDIPKGQGTDRTAVNADGQNE